jgi:dipeptidase
MSDIAAAGNIPGGSSPNTINNRSRVSESTQDQDTDQDQTEKLSFSDKLLQQMNSEANRFLEDPNPANLNEAATALLQATGRLAVTSAAGSDSSNTDQDNTGMTRAKGTEFLM